jgi:hypothetical protein
MNIKGMSEVSGMVYVVKASPISGVAEGFGVF